MRHSHSFLRQYQWLETCRVSVSLDPFKRPIRVDNADTMNIDKTVVGADKVEKLLTNREVSEILGVSTRTLWTLVDTGELPAVRIGRLVRFHPADLNRFIERSRIAHPVQKAA